MKQLILTLAFVLACCSLALGQTTKTSTASDCPLAYSNLSVRKTIPSTGERVEMKFFSCRVGPGGILIYQMKGVALITPVSIDLTQDPVEVKFQETEGIAGKIANFLATGLFVVLSVSKYTKYGLR